MPHINTAPKLYEIGQDPRGYFVCVDDQGTCVTHIPSRAEAEKYIGQFKEDRIRQEAFEARCRETAAKLTPEAKATFARLWNQASSEESGGVDLTPDENRLQYGSSGVELTPGVRR